MTRAPLGPRWGYGPAVLIGTACATAAVLLSPPAAPAQLVLTSLVIGAAGFTAAGLYRTLAPLAGRSEEADVVIQDPYASEFHLRLTSQDQRLTVHDLGSTNGTYVNGRRISAATALRRGDALQVGKTVMEVR